MHRLYKNWLIGAAAATAFTGAFFAIGVILDGPSASDITRMEAADLKDAKARAAHEAVLLKRCQDMRGPRAEIVHIRNTEDYACRMKDGSII